MNKVENLKKITLVFQAGTCPEIMNLRPRHSEFEFIFGLSPEGMTPFEYELVDKFVGEEISLYLKARIIGVAAPETREIIKAMAERAQQSQGGCAGGDCDCG